MRECVIALHARERSSGRLGAWRACRIRRLWATSFKVPSRLAGSLPGREGGRIGRKGEVAYRVSGDVLLVCRGRRVLTLWRLETEQVATLPGWRFMGVWLQGAS